MQWDPWNRNVQPLLPTQTRQPTLPNTIQANVTRYPYAIHESSLNPGKFPTPQAGHVIPNAYVAYPQIRHFYSYSGLLPLRQSAPQPNPVPALNVPNPTIFAQTRQPILANNPAAKSIPQYVKPADKNISQYVKPVDIRVVVKTSSRNAEISWSLPQSFRPSYPFEYIACLEGKRPDTKGVDVQRLQFPSTKLHTSPEVVPGNWYTVKIAAVACNSGGTVIAKGDVKFRAVFDVAELEEYLKLAIGFMGRDMCEFQYFYRNKPRRYWDEIHQLNGGIMRPYLKDKNGHDGCPINDVVHGLFFNGKLISGGIPTKSPFGELRIDIPAHALLTPQHNLYFADFYCNAYVHYVTVVMCRRNSQADQFCSEFCLPIDIRNNPFLRVEDDGRSHPRFFINQNRKAWVECFYTDDVDLQKNVVSWIECNATVPRPRGESPERSRRSTDYNTDILFGNKRANKRSRWDADDERDSEASSSKRSRHDHYSRSSSSSRTLNEDRDRSSRSRRRSPDYSAMRPSSTKPQPSSSSLSNKKPQVIDGGIIDDGFDESASRKPTDVSKSSDNVVVIKDGKYSITSPKSSGKPSVPKQTSEKIKLKDNRLLPSNSKSVNPIDDTLQNLKSDHANGNGVANDAPNRSGLSHAATNSSKATVNKPLRQPSDTVSSSSKLGKINGKSYNEGVIGSDEKTSTELSSLSDAPRSLRSPSTSSTHEPAKKSNTKQVEDNVSEIDSSANDLKNTKLGQIPLKECEVTLHRLKESTLKRYGVSMDEHLRSCQQAKQDAQLNAILSSRSSTKGFVIPKIKSNENKLSSPPIQRGIGQEKPAISSSPLDRVCGNIEREKSSFKGAEKQKPISSTSGLVDVWGKSSNKNRIEGDLKTIIIPGSSNPKSVWIATELADHKVEKEDEANRLEHRSLDPPSHNCKKENNIITKEDQMLDNDLIFNFGHDQNNVQVCGDSSSSQAKKSNLS